MILSSVAVPDTISRRNMSTGADEQIIERQQSLSVLQLRLRESYRPNPRFAGECPLQMWPEVARLERQQDPVEPFRVRVHGENWLPADVFCRVRDQPILTERDDQVTFRKDVCRNQRAIHYLNLEPRLDRAPHEREGPFI